MGNKYDQSTASTNAGSARDARPSVRVDAIVFWITILCALPVFAYQLGYDSGFDSGRQYANGVCKIVCYEPRSAR